MNPQEAKKLQDICDDFLEATIETAREKKLRSVYVDMRESVADGFRAQKKEFLKNFEKYKKTLFNEALGGSEVNNELEKIFTITDELIKAPINEGVRKAIETGGMQAMKEVGEGLSFNIEHPEAVNYINKRGAEAVTQINETTRKRINRIVTSGLQKGKSYDKVAKEISDEFEQFAVGRPQKHIDSRAHHVAVTEAGNAFEHGNSVGANQMEEMGLDIEKSWHTVGDEEVSQGCADNESDGWIKKNELHTSGHQHPLRFPGCRCHERYRRNPEQKVTAQQQKAQNKTPKFSTADAVKFDKKENISSIKRQFREKFGSEALYVKKLKGAAPIEDNIERLNMAGETIGNQILAKNSTLRNLVKKAYDQNKQRAGINLIADERKWPAGERTGVLAHYVRNSPERKGTIRIGSANAKRTTDSLDRITDSKYIPGNVATDYRSIIRHEYGHHVHLKILDAGDKEIWDKFYTKKLIDDKSYFIKNISEYAGTNHKEAFAEAFCAYTSPLYGTSKYKKLPKEIEETLEQIIGRREDL
jgi:hypothetical protein